MEKLTLRKVTSAIARIIEVVSWFGVGCLLVTSLVLTINKNLVMNDYESQAAAGGHMSFTTSGGVDLTERFITSIGNGTVFFELLPYNIKS